MPERDQTKPSPSEDPAYRSAHEAACARTESDGCVGQEVTFRYKITEASGPVDDKDDMVPCPYCDGEVVALPGAVTRCKCGGKLFMLREGVPYWENSSRMDPVEAQPAGLRPPIAFNDMGAEVHALFAADGTTYRTHGRGYVWITNVPITLFTPGEEIIIGADTYTVLDIIPGPDGPYVGGRRIKDIGPGLVIEAALGEVCHACAGKSITKPDRVEEETGRVMCPFCSMQVGKPSCGHWYRCECGSTVFVDGEGRYEWVKRTGKPDKVDAAIEDGRRAYLDSEASAAAGRVSHAVSQRPLTKAEAFASVWPQQGSTDRKALLAQFTAAALTGCVGLGVAVTTEGDHVDIKVNPQWSADMAAQMGLETLIEFERLSDDA